MEIIYNCELCLLYLPTTITITITMTHSLKQRIVFIVFNVACHFVGATYPHIGLRSSWMFLLSRLLYGLPRITYDALY